MPLCELKEVCGGPWGIVADRRAEVEAAGYGGFDRIVNEEIAKRFIPVSKAALLLSTHVCTAGRWLNEHEARYIQQGKARLWFVEDVIKVVEHRNAAKAVTQKEKRA